MSVIPVSVELTKKGYPAMWEKGGGMSSTGKATIITGPDGSRLKPFYVRTGGHLAGAEHALLPATKGNLIIEVWRHYKDFTITIMKIISEPYKDTLGRLTVNCEVVNKFNNGEWDKGLEEWLASALEAAKDKSWDYHCRKPYYISE
jgi:hypothetical protein